MKLYECNFIVVHLCIIIFERPQVVQTSEERLVHRPVQQIIEVPVPQIVEEASGARADVGSELERHLPRQPNKTSLGLEWRFLNCH